jgi:hypothetical protein
MAVPVPGKDRHKKLNGGSPLGWVIKTPKIIQHELTSSPASLVGIISTWFDSDIIEANVKNCFKQGFDRVLILDNASHDKSVSRAVACGAQVGEVYETAFYDDDLRIAKENDIAKTAVESSSGDLWVVSLDADEFLHGFGGLTVKESLCSLPQQVRIIGSHAVDLYPESPDAYKIGEHPGICMPNGCLRKGVFCPNLHWKHVAIRYSNGLFDIAQTRGNHIPSVSKVSHAPSESCFSLPIIHAPFRRYEDSRARLKRLCGKDKSLGNKPRSAGDDQVTGNMGAIKRWNCLEDVYAGRWDRVEIPHCRMLYGREVTGICLYPWKNFFKDLTLESIL